MLAQISVLLLVLNGVSFVEPVGMRMERLVGKCRLELTQSRGLEGGRHFTSQARVWILFLGLS